MLQQNTLFWALPPYHYLATAQKCPSHLGKRTWLQVFMCVFKVKLEPILKLLQFHFRNNFLFPMSQDLTPVPMFSSFKIGFLADGPTETAVIPEDVPGVF